MLFPLLVFGSLLSTNDVPVKLPNCGVMAAFSLLHASGSPASLEDVKRQFSAPNEKVASMLEVRRAIDAFGRPTRAVKYASHRLSQVPLPAIFHFEHNKWSGTDDVGHYVTILELRENSVVLLDWSKLSPNRLGNLAEIEAAWDGAAIILDEGWNMGRWAMWLSPLAVAVLVYLTWRVRRVRPTHTLVSLLVAGSAVLSLGCGRSATAVTTTSSPITCSQPFVKLGEIRAGNMATVNFALTVAADQKAPVIIRQVKSTCGCTTVTNDLIGKPLEPGSVHKLEIKIRPSGDGSGAPVTRIITVETDPPSVPPLTLAAQYSLRVPLVISKAELIADTQPNQIPFVEFQITARRSPDDVTIAIQRDRSSLDPFQIDDIRVETELVDRGVAESGKLAIDRTTVRLRSTARSAYGEERGTILLSFSDGTTQAVPWRIRLRHPLRAQFPHYFLGSVKPGQPFRQVVRLLRSTDKSVDVKSVMANLAGTSSKMLSDHELEITGHAPQTAGRFEGHVELSFAETDIPTVRVPFAGVVAP